MMGRRGVVGSSFQRSLCLGLLLFGGKALATAGPQPSAASKAAARQASGSGVDYAVKGEAGEDDDGSDLFLPKVDQLFKNPAVLSSLQTGTDALNRSLDSVFDSIFYSLLDNKFHHDITPSYQYGLNLTRNVFTTHRGAHVVVDRIVFGPEYQRTLGHTHGIPVALGAHGHVDILDIYLRTDAQRLAEAQTLPYWRASANNWFGLLPFLTQILPPSFNASELYDPLRQLQTPLAFPLSLQGFAAMHIGSIRSYALTGGVSVPIHLGARVAAGLASLLARYKLVSALPYTLFVDGEHRINVLRRGEHTAWVGLTHSRRAGHSLAGVIGNTVFLLANAIKPIPWQGVALYFSPVDLEATAALVHQYDHLFEFDTADPEGGRAYLEAVKGNFAFATERLRAQPKHPGIKYHFTKTRRSTEVSTKLINNLIVARSEQSDKREKAEVQIDDAKGTFFVLEDIHEAEDLNWQILEGEEEVTLTNKLEVDVERRGLAKNKKFAFRHNYSFAGSNPFHLITSLAIKDRFANSQEYNTYVAKLRKLSQLPLDGVPSFPEKSAERLLAQARQSYFTQPHRVPSQIHTTADIMGRFYASLDLHFPTPVLRAIMAKSLSEKRQAASQAFGLSSAESKLLGARNWLTLARLHLQRAIAWPFHAFYLKYPQANSYFAAARVVASLEKLRGITSPLALIEEFNELFAAGHPEELLGTLFRLGGSQDVARKVSFYMQPSPYLDPGYKVQLQKLNQATYSGTAKFPSDQRYRIAQEKATAFYPYSVKEMRSRPLLTHVHINTRQGTSPAKQSPTAAAAAILFVHLRVKNVVAEKPSHFYLRFETAGKLNIGKIVLGEEVISLYPLQHDPETFNGDLEFEFDITGDDSPLQSFLFDKAVGLGTDFMLSVATSADRQVWSQEKTFRFRYSDGVLKPPQSVIGP